MTLPLDPAPGNALSQNHVVSDADGADCQGPADPEATLPPADAPAGPAPAGEAQMLTPAVPVDSQATLPPAKVGSAAAGGGAGSLVPGYEILGELGRGGMGVVYKAWQVGLGRPVALKMILSGDHAAAADRARFRTEAEAIARLQHLNIVQVYEVGEQEGKPFFSLEFCSGGSLDKKLNGTPLPAAEAARLVQTLARAMHAAHERGVIHRDLKPANVLLTDDGTPKITDFGLARKLDEAGQTASGAILGTPSYMAPEQAGGKSKEIGPAADVYALGAILYELLTGRPPFKAATALDTVLQVVADEPVPPRQLQPKVPRDLETLCLKCLRKEPPKRCASAAELADELERFLRGEPIQARPAGRVERAAKWVRRHKGLSAGLAAAVLALLLGTAVASWQAVVARVAASNEATQRRSAEDARHAAEDKKKAANTARKVAEDEKKGAEAARQRAEEEKKRAEEQLGRTELALYAGQLAQAQREWQDGNGARALELLDGCQWNLRHVEYRHLWTLYNSNQMTFRGHTRGVASVAFSPDGKRLASASADRTVKVWDADKGQELLSLKGHTDWVNSVAFSPDGKRLASASGDNTVKVWDADKGQEVLTLKGHTSQVFSVAFSPDGKRLASASGDGTVKVWDADRGNEVLSLTGHTGWVSSVAYSPDGKRLATGSQDQTVKVWLLAALLGTDERSTLSGSP